MRSCLDTVSAFPTIQMVDHTISMGKVIYAAFIIVVFVAIACGCVNIKYFIKCTTLISVAASICLIAQYGCFYLFGFHLQFVPTQFLLPESSAWILGVKTGLFGINGEPNGFYRPSAFFWNHPTCSYILSQFYVCCYYPPILIKRGNSVQY